MNSRNRQARRPGGLRPRVKSYRPSSNYQLLKDRQRALYSEVAENHLASFATRGTLGLGGPTAITNVDQIITIVVREYPLLFRRTARGVNVLRFCLCGCRRLDST